MAFDSQPLEDAFDAGRTLAPAAVGTQVLIMSAISLVTLVVFNILRPRNKIVYEPKVKYHVGDKSPPSVGDTFCGWLPPLMHTKEPELLEKVGLDAVAFLRFLRLMRSIFAGVAILTCCILIPINFSYNRDHVKPNKRDALSMLTIRDVKGNALYIHVTVSYLITILVIVLLYVHGRAMVNLRNEFFRSPEYIKSFYARTLSITHIQRKFQHDAGLNDILGKNAPHHPTSLHIARDVGDLPQLVDYHNQTVRDFEAVLVKYLKGNVHNKRRPTVSFGGVLGIGAVRKDAIEYYTKKLKQTEAAVEEYRLRIDARKPENYGFASYAAVPYAHRIAKYAAGKHPKGAVVTLAPNPKDIIWSNMNKSNRAIAVKRLIGFGWLIVVCFLSLIPLLLVAALANLDAVSAAGYLPFLDNWSGHSAVTFAIVSGVVPPAVSGLFTVFLPRIMRWLGKYQGALTRARLDRAVVARYFAFLVISQLIVFTLIGVMINSVTELVELIGKHASAKAILANLNKLPGRVSKTYINTSTYWLKFFPLRGFLVVFDLAQIVKLLWISFKTRVMGRTPRDIREWTKPPSFEYAIYYSNLLFMCTVGLVFAPLVPLVALAAAVLFWVSSWVYKYQLMFVFVTKVETGGRLWNVIINRVLVSLFLMQCLMILTIGLQLSFRSIKMIIAIPPILMIILFKIYLDRKLNKNFYYYLPGPEELRASQVHSSRGDTVKQKLVNRFGHPSLHAELFTPMVHADQMPLLRQVYGGKIEITDEGKKVQVLDGLRIQPILQRDLEYDPVLYSRDRGEYDYDRYSIPSSSLLSPGVLSPGINKGPPSRAYTPHSHAGSDADSAMSRPQSIFSSPSGDPRRQTMLSPGPNLSPAPQSYFDPRLSVVLGQPGSPSMHTRDSSRPMSAASTSPQPEHLARPQHSRESSVTPLSVLVPLLETGDEHRPMSGYSQDSVMPPIGLRPPQPRYDASTAMDSQDAVRRVSSHPDGSHPLPSQPGLSSGPEPTSLQPLRPQRSAAYSMPTPGHQATPSSSSARSLPPRPAPNPRQSWHVRQSMQIPSSVTARQSTEQPGIVEVPGHPDHGQQPFPSPVFRFGAPYRDSLPEGAQHPSPGPVFQFGAPSSDSDSNVSPH